jgi:hypothetical protein
MRHEPLDLLARHVLQRGGPLRAPDSLGGFLAALRASIESAVANPQFLYGKRTESLFEMIVASLGAVRLLKSEDSGDAFHNLDGGIRVPDFRIVLEGGQQCLIEVKNFYQKRGDEPYTMDTEYVQGLVNYSRTMSCRLFFAVYWTRWNIWTLVDEPNLETVGEVRRLALGNAMAANEMALVGDKMIGTRSPLRIRLGVESERRSIDGAEQVVTIRSTQISSEDRVLSHPNEVRFATFLIFNGDWEEVEQVDVDDRGNIVSVVFEYAPTEERNGDKTQGFSFVGTMSGMLSRQYAAQTVIDGEVALVRGAFEPGHAGDLIPTRGPDTALPLWVIMLQPRQPPQLR